MMDSIEIKTNTNDDNPAFAFQDKRRYDTIKKCRRQGKTFEVMKKKACPPTFSQGPQPDDIIESMDKEIIQKSNDFVLEVRLNKIMLNV